MQFFALQPLFFFQQPPCVYNMPLWPC